MASRRRLDPEIFNLPVAKMRAGYYSDKYFVRAREILLADGYRPRVSMQVFGKSHAWIGTGTPSMPSAVRELLESVPATRGLLVEDVHPEHRIPFDARRGEPRNADLAFLGHAARGTVAVTIEGKADEPFGDTVGDTLSAALQRWNDNDRSGGAGA